jgi:hypothetical protein
MMLMIDNSSMLMGYFAGKYPGRIGMLFSPKHFKVPPYFMPYACDNGAFNGFEEKPFCEMLIKTTRVNRKPMWICVPDKLEDAEETLRLWFLYKKRVSEYGPLAFVVQDGMEPSDVPHGASCVFVGGSTAWKWNNANKFKGVCEFLHIGRVNSLDKLEFCNDIGADSVDGTGWFRARDKKYYDMIRWFEGDEQQRLFYGR